MSARPLLQVVVNGPTVKTPRQELTESEGSLAAAYGGLRRALKGPMPGHVRINVAGLAQQLENAIVLLNSQRHQLPELEDGGCPHNVGSTDDSCGVCGVSHA